MVRATFQVASRVPPTNGAALPTPQWVLRKQLVLVTVNCLELEHSSPQAQMPFVTLSQHLAS